MENIMYTFTEKIVDKNLHVNDGQFVAGVAIGIILFGQTGYALPPGSVENATTFKYPVYYRAIEAASVESVVSPKVDPEVLHQLVETGKEMEAQGCRAVVGACGYFANYLPEVKKALEIPCFFSSIMQVPIILNSLCPGKKVGILCANGSVLSTAPVLRNCGIHDFSSVVITGAEGLPEMQKILQGRGFYNPVELEKGLIRLAMEMVEKNPEIEAILLECTLFPTHALAIQKTVRMPVYDFTTLIDWVYSAVVRRSFKGYL